MACPPFRGPAHLVLVDEERRSLVGGKFLSFAFGIPRRGGLLFLGVETLEVFDVPRVGEDLSIGVP